MDNFKIFITEGNHIVNEFELHFTNFTTATEIAESYIKCVYTDNCSYYVFYTC